VSKWFVDQLGAAPAEVYGMNMNQASLSMLEYAKYLMEGYSHEIIFFLLSCIAIVSFLYRIRIEEKVSNSSINEIIFTVLFIVFSLSTLIFLFGSFIVSNPQRQFLYALMVSTILNGLFFIRLMNRAPRKYLIIASCILIPCIIIGISSSYSSILMGSINSHVTKASLSGASWFANYSDFEGNDIYSIHNEFYRSIYATLGRDFENRDKVMHFFKKMPPLLNISGSNPYYLVFSDYMISKYTIYWPDNPEFPECMSPQLNNYYNLNKIYDSNGLDIYHNFVSPSLTET
jgi:hypothetical protein